MVRVAPFFDSRCIFYHYVSFSVWLQRISFSQWSKWW